MPVLPGEEEAPSGLTEKIAKDPSSTTESTASDHEHHHNEHTPGSGMKASAKDFQSKGPQIPMNMDGTPKPFRSRCWCNALLIESVIARHATKGQQGGTQSTCGGA